MAPSKRKRDEIDDSDEDEAPFGRQILPVANLPEDFDGVPMDGMQYLFTVRRDARHLPHVTRVANPYEVPEPSRAPSPKSHSNVVHTLLPSKEWRTLFGTRFQNFRKNINQPTIHVSIPAQEGQRKLFPNVLGRNSWWAFIAGQPESEWNPPKKPKKLNQYMLRRLGPQLGQGMRGWDEDSVEEESTSNILQQNSFQTNDEGEVEQVLRVDPTESLPTPTGTPAPSDVPVSAESPESSTSAMPVGSPESIKVVPREPSTTVLRNIDERMALHLLMYFTHWINVHVEQTEASKHIVTDTHARWMFALLSRIDDHISADDISLLRNLARACLAYLKLIVQERTAYPLIPEATSTSPSDSEKTMSERSCWIIFSIVVDIWKQHDLWEDAHDLLSRIPS
ncbi:hypothetical protein BDQ12DRAFT_675416 [Crucibulum laeve]|uniref:Survival motor neuron interacting protein 1-domain-containing protein n=1 Tax=Crucibulum laeve TaxID=68775 RepID=A0A5C3MEC7_9AGAR|nr:hypothetical protein BDQ12DRAFT_675416 [Crucibulum laeve]